MSDEPVRDGGDQDDDGGPTDVAEPSPEDFAAEPPTAPVRSAGGVGALRLVALLLIGLLVVAPLVILPLALRGPRAGEQGQDAVWRTVTSRGGEPWRVELPAEPTFTTTAVTEPAFVMTEANLATTNGAFRVASGTLPGSFMPGAAADQLLDAWEALLVGDAAPGAPRVVSRGADQVDGLPARTVDLALTPSDPPLEADARMWLVAVDRRVYAFRALRPPGDLSHPDVRRFVDSVRLPR